MLLIWKTNYRICRKIVACKTSIAQKNIIPCTHATGTRASAGDAASLNTSTLDTKTTHPIQEYQLRFLEAS
jgi:hypothetical protein